ncbi:MAG: serine--tRNA ligase [Candidatus Niyogibacteria bacterium]|nr:serine--tRNA ligase [Candidatus Niyogibacteria bacterium]
MLDIKFIRENPDLIKAAARKKRVDFDVNELLKTDEERKNLLAKIEELRAKQNKVSEGIVRIKNEAEKQAAIEISRALKNELSARENEFRKLDERWRDLMLAVPNIPDPEVPEGESDAQNKEIRKWEETPRFDFPIKDHLALMRDLNLLDLERGAKVSGFRGYFLKGEGAFLSLALWQLALKMLEEKGFTAVFTPVLVREKNFIGTGWLPQGKEEIYKTQDELYLAGTAEVPMMGYYGDEILKEDDLPIKFAAFSPCFRREAGSYGKDTRGIYRLHEFMKVEQVVLCRADHRESVKWHEAITKNSEELVQALGLPYRVVLNCGGDLGQGQVKKYDLEIWVPSEKKYRESHSSSYFHDFQTRRLNIKYRGADGKIRFAHSLNNTAVATPRILISLLENNQQKDGSIKIPEILQKYVGRDFIKLP